MKQNVNIFIVFIIVFTGCISGNKIDRRYYTIEIPADLITTGTDSILQIKGNCEIEQVVVNELYEKNQIVNRARSNEISYYIYNQWAISPSDAITQVIKEYIDVTGIFQDITDRYRRSIPDYRFWTSINSLELIERTRSFSAHLNLEFKLIDNSNNKIIVSHRADRVNALKEKDLNLFALEVSRIIQEELNIFVGMINDRRYLFSRDALIKNKN